MRNIIIAFVAVLVLVVGFWLYKRPSAPSVNGGNVAKGEVIVYVAHDKNYCLSIFEDFTKDTGIKVQALYDTETNKTVGLYNKIIEEKDNPRCDLHWNNEPLHSVRLTRQGLYTPYVSQYAAEVPDNFKDASGNWCGFAARARVIIYNTSKEGANKIASLQDFIDPQYKGKLCIVRPVLGSTLTHMAALYTYWGKDDFVTWLKSVMANDVKFLESNGRTAEAVATGQFLAGLTDTDDVIERKEARGMNCDLNFPDEAGIGTLLFPNTLALVKGGPNSGNAKILYDWLLKNEMKFCIAESAQIPLRKSIKAPQGRFAISDIKAMEVNWSKMADIADDCTKLMNVMFPQ